MAEGAETVAEKTGHDRFDLAMVLGSGLGGVASRLEDPTSVPYREIPGLPETTVSGHEGCLVAGTFSGRRVLAFQGRFHLYEGCGVDQVVRPVVLANALGCRRLLLTNAVGGINERLVPGDLMFVEDHLNLTGANPLEGGMFPDPFIDLSRLYAMPLFDPLSVSAAEAGFPLYRGVLAAVKGPNYETPAEIRMLGRLGADAVGMSTVPEAIMAGYFGMEVAGISLVTNRAAGLGPAPLSHQEVLEVGQCGSRRLEALLPAILSGWFEHSSP